MLKEVKNYLLNKKWVIIFLCFFVIIGLFFPLQNAKADLLGIIDTFNAMFEGIEEEAAPLAKEIIQVFIAYAVGLIALYTSSNLLNLAVNGQSSWLTIQTNPMVQAGWRFTSGLANLFLILIFVVIAIAYILKLETFQAKKALPRLIMVALLLNFSLVFIGALVDISNIFYNTVLKGNENVILEFIDILGAGGSDVWVNLGLWFVLLAGLWIVPFIGPFAQLAFVILVVGIGFLPNIITWAFQIVLFLMISGVFFTYTFLFAVRVFLIQILAILAPLAFICLILPQTKKYWDEWLQHLLGWLFLGIFLLFFLAIGIRAANAIVPPGGLTPIPFLGWGQIAAYFTYYFFLFIYFILVIWVSKKFMPTLAAFIIAQATSWGNVAWQRAIKPFGEVFKKSGERVRREKTPESWRRWGERQLAKPIWGTEVPGVKGAAMRVVGTVPYGFRRGIGITIAGAGLAEAEMREVDREKAKATKLVSAEAKMAEISRAGATRATRVGTLIAGVEDKQTKDLKKLGLTDENVIRIGREALQIHPERFKTIRDAYPHLAEKMGEGLTKEVKEKGGVTLTEEEKKKYESVVEKLAAEMKEEKFEAMSKDAVLDPYFMQALHLHGTGRQITRAARTFGRDFVDEFMKGAEERGQKWYRDYNPKLYESLQRTAAIQVGLGLPEEEKKKTDKERPLGIPPAPAEEEKKEEKRKRGRPGPGPVEGKTPESPRGRP